MDRRPEAKIPQNSTSGAEIQRKVLPLEGNKVLQQGFPAAFPMSEVGFVHAKR
jgi:hypothetical protein